MAAGRLNVLGGSSDPSYFGKRLIRFLRWLAEISVGDEMERKYMLIFYAQHVILDL